MILQKQNFKLFQLLLSEHQLIKIDINVNNSRALPLCTH